MTRPNPFIGQAVRNLSLEILISSSDGISLIKNGLSKIAGNEFLRM
jgi:hypothetical protein